MARWMVLVIGWGCCWWRSVRARARAPFFLPDFSENVEVHGIRKRFLHVPRRRVNFHEIRAQELSFWWVGAKSVKILVKFNEELTELERIDVFVFSEFHFKLCCPGPLAKAASLKAALHPASRCASRWAVTEAPGAQNGRLLFSSWNFSYWVNLSTQSQALVARTFQRWSLWVRAPYTPSNSTQTPCTV